MTWSPTPAEAKGLQLQLRERVCRDDDLPHPIRSVGGADVWFGAGQARAALAVHAYPDLGPLGEATAEQEVGFPYVPGLFSFRELPPLLAACEALGSDLPGVILCDAHGLAHPRRFGLACHLGVVLDCPTVGCAKSILVGDHGPLAPERGARADLLIDGEVVGAAVRTRTGVKPVYVSVGHRVSLDAAVALVLACSRTRIPEPLRRADRLSRGRG